MYGNPYTPVLPGPGYGPQPGYFTQPNFTPGPFGAPQQPAQTAPGVNMPVVMQVPTLKQVDQAPVQPGGKALVLVANEPVIAMKVADNMGITTTDYYHIAKFDPDAAAPAPAGDFVPRSEFSQTVQALLDKIQQMQPPQAAPTEKEEAKA